MTDFADRPGVALVTGATGGIGRAVATLLAERGCDLALVYRGASDVADALASDLRESGSTVRTYRADLTDDAACARLADAVTRDAGNLHTVVHAAGPHVPQSHLSTVAPSVLRDQLVDDAAATYSVLHACLPALRAARGAAVVVTTAATRRYPVRDGLSAVPKGAVEQIVRAFAAEEGRFGVRLNCVGPGMLTDGMAERLIASGDLDDRALEVTRRNIPLRRFGRAVDIAEAVAFLASDRAGFVTGQMLDVDGGYSI